MYQPPCNEPAVYKCSSPELMFCLISIKWLLWLCHWSLLLLSAFPRAPQSRHLPAFPTKQLIMTRASFVQAGIIGPSACRMTRSRDPGTPAWQCSSSVPLGLDGFPPTEVSRGSSVTVLVPSAKPLWPVVLLAHSLQWERQSWQQGGERD